MTLTEKRNKNRIMNDNGFRKVVRPGHNQFCDFIANDGNKEKRVFYASTIGLDWPENSHCHVSLQLYYETHMAMDIQFSTHKDAWDYVTSEGKIDRRIIEKEALSGSHGWKLTLKGA